MSVIEAKHLIREGFLTSLGRRVQMQDSEHTYQNDATRLRLFYLPGNVPVVTWLDRVTMQVRVFVDAHVDKKGESMVVSGLEIAPAEWN